MIARSAPRNSASFLAFAVMATAPPAPVEDQLSQALPGPPGFFQAFQAALNETEIRPELVSGGNSVSFRFRGRWVKLVLESEAADSFGPPMRNEAAAYLRLLQKPHPNVAKLEAFSTEIMFTSSPKAPERQYWAFVLPVYNGSAPDFSALTPKQREGLRAGALHLHLAGIWQRDQCPANTMILDGDEVIHIDFGCSKVFEPGERPQPGSDAHWSEKYYLDLCEKYA